MKPKERFLAALKGEETDRVPLYDFLFQKPLYTELIGKTPDGYDAVEALELTAKLGLDAVSIPFGAYTGCEPVMISDNVYKDEWGTTFEKNEASWPVDAPIEYPIVTRDDLSSYVPPDPRAEGRLEPIGSAIAANKDDIALFCNVQGPFSTAWMLMGYERISFALYDDPEIIRQIMRMSNDYFKVAAKLVVAAGADGIILADDLGHSTGGFVSNAHFTEFVFPPFKELVQHIKGLGVPVMLHTCGCVKQYMDMFIEAGVEAIHPIQRTAGMDLRETKEKYGDRLCIIGNIDSSRTLPYGTPDDVRAEVKEAIQIAAPGGRYVLASDHSLHDGIPVENIVAMFDAAREYGQYPISI